MFISVRYDDDLRNGKITISSSFDIGIISERETSRNRNWEWNDKFNKRRKYDDHVKEWNEYDSMYP